MPASTIGAGATSGVKVAPWSWETNASEGSVTTTIDRGQWLYGAVLFSVANVAIASSLVFYDALLPHVAAADDMDRVSTAGYAIGYLGGGILLAQASEELRAFVDHLQIPVAHSLMGKGALADDHPLVLGMTGFWGTQLTNDTCLAADWVLGLAFSPDGEHLASASRDRTARVFALASGQIEASHQGHEAPVSGVAFSADGKTVFSGGCDRDVHYWGLNDAKKAGKISGAEGELFRVLLAGENLFSAGADKQIRQHRTDDHALICTFSGHAERITALAAHTPQQWVASGALDGEVRVWSWNDGKLVKSFPAFPR